MSILDLRLSEAATCNGRAAAFTAPWQIRWSSADSNSFRNEFF